MESNIAIPKYYSPLRDCDIELTLKNVEVLLRLRSEAFIKSQKHSEEGCKKMFDEYILCVNSKIKEYLNL